MLAHNCGDKVVSFEYYDLLIVDMMFRELRSKDCKLFEFIKDINIYIDVDFFYVLDNSLKQKYNLPFNNKIYVNIGDRKNSTYRERAKNIIDFFPDIIHKLYHFYQKKKYGVVIYTIASLPVIKDITIDIAANDISNAAEYLIEDIEDMSQLEFSLLKMKHLFPRYTFDEEEKKMLKKEDLWKWL